MIDNSSNKPMSWTDTAYSMGSTIYTSWKTASPTTRLAVKGTASLCLPGGALVQMAGLAATVWSESAPSAPVVQEPTSITPPSPAAPVVLPKAPIQIETPTLGELENITDQIVEKFAKTAANYATLYTMYYLICDIKEENADISIQEIVNEAEKKTDSLWEIFHERYKDRLSYFQIAKARLFFFCCYQIPIIPNATDAYLKKIVDVIRDHLTHDPKKRTKLIEDLIKNNTDLFATINDVITDFSKGEFDIKKEKNGQLRSLKVHIKKTIKKWLKKTSDEQRLLQIAQTFLNDYPVRIPFQFGEKPLNWIFSKVLKKWILPSLVSFTTKNLKQQLFENGKEYVRVVKKDGTHIIEKRDRAYNPFFLMITDQINFQLTELQKALLSGTAVVNSRDSIKIQGLELLTENFVKMIHLLPPNSQQTDIPLVTQKLAYGLRIKNFEKKPKIIKNTEIQWIMQRAQIGVDYLSDPTTLEGFLALLVDSANRSFSNKITVKSESVWEQEHTLYAESAQKLKTVTKDILTQTIGAAITSVTEEPTSYLNAAKGKTILSVLPIVSVSLYCFLPPYLAALLNGLATMALSNVEPLLSVAATQDSTKAAQIAKNMFAKAGTLGLITSMLPAEIAIPTLAFTQITQLSSVAPTAVDQAIETSKTLALNEATEMADKTYDVITDPSLYLANFRFFMREWT